MIKGGNEMADFTPDERLPIKTDFYTLPVALCKKVLESSIHT